MRREWKGLALVVVLLCGCAAPPTLQAAWEKSRAANHDKLAEQYSPSARRSDVIAATGEPDDSTALPAATPPNGFLDFAIRQVENEGGHTVAWCDVYYVDSAGKRSSHPAAADYVFYDNAGRLITSHRRAMPF